MALGRINKFGKSEKTETFAILFWREKNARKNRYGVPPGSWVPDKNRRLQP